MTAVAPPPSARLAATSPHQNAIPLLPLTTIGAPVPAVQGAAPAPLGQQTATQTPRRAHWTRTRHPITRHFVTALGTASTALLPVTGVKVLNSAADVNSSAAALATFGGGALLIATAAACGIGTIRHVRMSYGQSPRPHQT